MDHRPASDAASAIFLARRHVMKTLFCTTALSVFALAAFAQEESSIPMDQVPAVVAEAAMANAMGVTFNNIQLDHGVYEF